MIASIRAYIITQIQTCYPDKFQIDDPIGEDDLSRNDATNGFKIIFGSLNGFVTGNSYGNIIPVEIQIFKKSGLETTTPFDELFDEAVEIKNRLLVPTLVKVQTIFNDIEFLSIEPSSLGTDDKTYKMSLNFNVRVDFTF